MAHSLFP